MFNIDNRQLIQLEHRLKILKERSIPFAVKNTVNGLAFKAQQFGRKNVEEKMINRNEWSKRSIHVERARGLNISQMSSKTGSIAGYMEAQELGGIKRKNGKEGTPIPTNDTSRERGSMQERKKPVTNGNRLRNIHLKKGRRIRSNGARARSQRLTRAVQSAITTGRRKFFFDLGGDKKKGIFSVRGGSKNFHRGWPRGAKLRMLWDMSEDSVSIPRNPWLVPARDEALVFMPSLYAASLRYQLDRLR